MKQLNKLKASSNQQPTMERFMKLRDWINIDKLKWKEISKNSNAIHLLEQYPENIHWNELSKNPKAMHILEQNSDKFNWYCLSQNPKAIHILEQNLDKIVWRSLSFNKNIFTYDYERLSIEKRELHRDFIEYFWNPKTIQTFCMKHGYDEEEHDLIEIYSSCFQL